MICEMSKKCTIHMNCDILAGWKPTDWSLVDNIRI
jgi:hypothetical protein